MSTSILYRLILGICLAMLSFLSGIAQADLPYEPLPNSLLWEIRGEGLSRPSYVYGTIHLIPKDSFFITDVVKEAMGEADELVLEVPIADMGIGDMMKMMQYMYLPQGESLDKLLSKQDYAYLDSFIQTLPQAGMQSVSMESLNHMQPMMSMQQITSLYCSQFQEEKPQDKTLEEPALDLGSLFGGGSGGGIMGMAAGEDNVIYEVWFSERFKANDRPITGLETAEDQMKVLTGMPPQKQAQDMVEALKKPEEMCGQLDNLVSVYRRQAIQEMVDMSAEDAQLGDQLDAFLDKRNKNWIPLIEEKLHSGRACYFIAVGAAHLAGPNGVIHLLREAGYTLTPRRE